MSEDEVSVDTSDNTQYLTAEFKDGRLEIVEVTPFDKDKTNTHILPNMNTDGEIQPKYMQVLDSNKDMVQLDLLNFTLVRSENGEESYQLVANAECPEAEDVTSDNTVTCMLASDNEEHDNQDSYIIVDNDSDQPPLIFLQSALQQINHNKPAEPKKKVPPTPAEILEKAKALLKAKTITSQKPATKRGRKRKGDLPSPQELLSSPNFKLYLYSCKICSFKCNAIKEMSAHKAAEHGTTGRLRAAGAGAGAGGAGGAGGRGAGGAITLQCARCPFRAATHTQLMRHVQDRHMETTRTTGASEAVALDTAEVRAADVLVCGACGFESACRHAFRDHIENEHGATTC